LSSADRLEGWTSARGFRSLHCGGRKLVFEEDLALLQSFFSQFTSLPFDDDAAEEYGILRVLLEKAGTPMDANDLLIASVAMVHDLTVLTRKRTEFARVPGLRWEAW
jgi:tRNA(fMet)-specific endonuclease VapC